jgi:hypothetical protein
MDELWLGIQELTSQLYQTTGDLRVLEVQEITWRSGPMTLPAWKVGRLGLGRRAASAAGPFSSTMLTRVPREPQPSFFI